MTCTTVHPTACESLATDDLFLAAYALSEGAELVGVDIVVSGARPVATFRLSAPRLSRLERAYLDGTAMTNVNSLKRYLKYVKDVLFNRLRNEGRS